MSSLTKIIATIGPATESEEKIEALIKNGVNVFRFNFKHSSTEWHNERILRVNKVADKLKVHIGTLIDLQGPEIRINMNADFLELEDKEVIEIGPHTLNSKVKGFTISHPEVLSHLKNNQKVLADDGKISFKFIIKDNQKYSLISQQKGTLYNRKSINIPGAKFPFPTLLERDLEGLKLAQAREVDYVALSFVRSKNDIDILKKAMKSHKLEAQIVSKIEAEAALENLAEIIDASDGIMVARGDLAVELSREKVPYWQKKIIKQCIQKGKFVITATEMLESMIENPYPTRAEVSDIANASYDQSDAVMLSGESATGKYPVKAVSIMNKTLRFNEKKMLTDNRNKYRFEIPTCTHLIADAAYDMYLQMRRLKYHIDGFIVFSQTGQTARVLSMFRPKKPIYAICPKKQTAESLALNLAVIPITQKNGFSKGTAIDLSQIKKASKALVVDRKSSKESKKEGRYIVVHGDKWGITGGASTIRIVTL